VTRRTLLKIIIVSGVIMAAIFSFGSSLPRKVFYRIQRWFNPPAEIPPDNQRGEASLPEAGAGTTVETALNSRCTSDYDDNPRQFHWGMFDRNRKLSHSQIEQITQRARVPSFAKGRASIGTEQGTLIFLVDNRETGLRREWAMVESGMQQQAVGLVCAALGVGHVHRSLGEEGKPLSGDEFATVQIKLDAMKPSYDGAYWSTSAPSDTRPWERGNLPDPDRKGGKALLDVLGELKTDRSAGKATSDRELGQLLWAARGRTPHFYKSEPWGLTIPTYRGEQTISAVHVVRGDRLLRYVNWKGNRPTHTLEDAGGVDVETVKAMGDRYLPGTWFIVLSRNEAPARALWEVGYQLLNLLLQAHSLGVSYKAVLLDEAERRIVRGAGIKEPVAMLVLQSQP